jgi:hypothetical protein
MRLGPMMRVSGLHCWAPIKWIHPSSNKCHFKGRLASTTRSLCFALLSMERSVRETGEGHRIEGSTTDPGDGWLLGGGSLAS